MFRKVIKYSKILATSRATIHKFEPQVAQITTSPHAAHVDADGKEFEMWSIPVSLPTDDDDYDVGDSDSSFRWQPREAETVRASLPLVRSVWLRCVCTELWEAIEADSLPEDSLATRVLLNAIEITADSVTDETAHMTTQRKGGTGLWEAIKHHGASARPRARPGILAARARSRRDALLARARARRHRHADHQRDRLHAEAPLHHSEAVRLEQQPRVLLQVQAAGAGALHAQRI